VASLTTVQVFLTHAVKFEFPSPPGPPRRRAAHSAAGRRRRGWRADRSSETELGRRSRPLGERWPRRECTRPLGWNPAPRGGTCYPAGELGATRRVAEPARSLVRQRRIPLVAAVRLIATSVKPVMSRYLGQTLAHSPLAEVPGPVPGGQNASGLGINRAQRL
jgi:hypothetical protein